MAKKTTRKSSAQRRSQRASKPAGKAGAKAKPAPKKPVKAPPPQPVEAAPPAPAKAPKYATAESMAKAQRSISVSEFFAKNRHLLGFDNPRKALLTTVKEAVDNSLDAC
ncbi:MAG TPA: DNA topoisomerase VI subunit B, partial [Phycisphaerae bacterium]|nr:DNA topoisomerase VI subunit B [Phycisphaerae bacterium]